MRQITRKIFLMTLGCFVLLGLSFCSDTKTKCTAYEEAKPLQTEPKFTMQDAIKFCNPDYFPADGEVLPLIINCPPYYEENRFNKVI